MPGGRVSEDYSSLNTYALESGANRTVLDHLPVHNIARKMNAINVASRNSLKLYFAIAFLIPIIAILYITLTEGLLSGLAIVELTGAVVVVTMFMVHAPAIAALIAAYRDQRIAGVKTLFWQLKFWSFSTRWYLAALLLLPATIVGTLLALSFFSPEYLPVLNMSFISLGTVVGAFWEELGWTGYATPKMLTQSSFLKVGVLLGVIHALWHLPASFWGSSVFHGDLFAFNFLATSVGIVALRIMTVWIYANTRSLVLGWLTHVSFTTGQVLLVSVALTSQATVIWNTAFMCALVVVSSIIIVRNRVLLKSTRYRAGRSSACLTGRKSPSGKG